MNPTPCRYCQKPIVFARVFGADKKIPLDARAPTYTISGDDTGLPMAMKSVALVSHFATCPNATQASNESRARREKRARGKLEHHEESDSVALVNDDMPDPDVLR